MKYNVLRKRIRIVSTYSTANLTHRFNSRGYLPLQQVCRVNIVMSWCRLLGLQFATQNRGRKMFIILRASPVGNIPPILHFNFHLSRSAVFIRRTGCRNVGAFKKAMLSWTSLDTKRNFALAVWIQLKKGWDNNFNVHRRKKLLNDVFTLPKFEMHTFRIHDNDFVLWSTEFLRHERHYGTSAQYKHISPTMNLYRRFRFVMWLSTDIEQLCDNGKREFDTVDVMILRHIHS